jgi:hypothetical protein
MIRPYYVGQDHSAPETIAVLGLEVVGTVDTASVRFARDLTTALRSIAAQGPYAIAPSSDRELVDLKLLYNCPDERKECMTKIGRALHAEHLLYGRVERTSQGGSSSYQVALWLLRIRDGHLASWTALVPAAAASGSLIDAWARRGYDHLLGSRGSRDSRGSRGGDDRVLIDATNRVFWEITKHKPGQRLDMTDARDRALSKTWMDIYGQVRGHRDRATQLAQRALKETGKPYVLVVEQRDGSLVHQEFPSRNHLDVMYNWYLAQPEDYTYLAMVDFTQFDFLQSDQFSLSSRRQSVASGW